MTIDWSVEESVGLLKSQLAALRERYDKAIACMKEVAEYKTYGLEVRDVLVELGELEVKKK